MKKSQNKRNRRNMLFAAILAVSIVPQVQAQSGSRNDAGGGTTGGGTAGGGGAAEGATIDSNGNFRVGAGGSSNASTPLSAKLHGVADALRAKGDAQRSAAEAAVSVERARGKAISNRVAAANAVVAVRQARYEADRLRRAYTIEVRTARQARLAVLRSRPKRTPDMLSVTEFNHYTGKVAWPTTLQGARFAKARAAVEKELQTHVKKTGSNEARLLTSIGTLQKLLGSQARSLGYREFAASNKFVNRLQNHIRYSDVLMKHREMLAAKM